LIDVEMFDVVKPTLVIIIFFRGNILQYKAFNLQTAVITDWLLSY